MRVSPRMVRCFTALALAGALLPLAGGCASNDVDNVIADEQSGQIDFKTKEQTYDGPSVSEQILQDDAQEIRREQDEVRGPEPQSNAQDNPELRIRDDGRPSWWFAGPRPTDVGLTVCAEALGPDMRQTREAAIDAGRTRLRSDLDLSADEPLADVEIMRVWVWPLPNAQPGANRYAGYVQMAAARP